MVIRRHFWSDRLFDDFTLLYLMRYKWLILILLFGSVFSMDAQCAMCRAVLESGESQDVAKSVNTGIKYLMLFPYLLIGGLAIIIYRKFRR